METPLFPESRMAHDWFYPITISYTPSVDNGFLDEVAGELLNCFQKNGHTILNDAHLGPQILLTTAAFGEALNWRKAYMFTGRMRFKLDYSPTVFTLMQATPAQFKQTIEQLASVLSKESPEVQDYPYQGLGPLAYQTLYEQGRRGGPVLALIRLVQVWSKSFRNILVVGKDHPDEAYVFDLVGAHPRLSAEDPQTFYNQLMNRMLASTCTRELVAHETSGEAIPQAEWQALSTPKAMRTAGLQFGKRNFFTEMVQVNNLTPVPALTEVVASQYSEGCFATWESRLPGLVTTITGSARPVKKDLLTDDELAVITGLRPERLGVFVREVEGKRNDPPSSEAVEMLLADQNLPRIDLEPEWKAEPGDAGTLHVPVVRSKLHGHRGVRAYNPSLVEHVYLDPSYYDYPVSCSTEAQAWAIQAAFSRSQALNNPEDPRKVVFTVLPGHGILITEKWVQGKQPFEVMWELMDSGALEIDRLIPQGRLLFVPRGEKRMEIAEMDKAS
jgi:hypothetical protein